VFFLGEEEIGDRDREKEYTYTYIRTRTHTKRRITLYIPEQSRLLIDNVRGVLKREGKSISNFFIEQLESYYRLHEPGNPQQRLDTILKLGKAYHAPSPVCGFKDCMRDSVTVGVFVQNGKEYGLCEKHLKEAKDCEGSWKFL
jgi:hypothetical protein